jgi:uncharacterized membrane protein YjgN (DUF898 family)
MDLPYEQPGAALPSAGQAIKISWKQPAGLYALSFINFLLRIVTLGIYGFWARTEVRKRIWSAVRIEGEPLHYTGTGKELFLGFLIVFFMLLVPFTVVTAVVVMAFGPESAAMSIYTLSLYVMTFLLIGVAIYRAQRYRLSRTRWRAIRGALVGSPNSYAWTYFWTGIVAVLSFGWALPWRSTKLQGIMTRDTRFGSEPFRFDATSGPLYARYAVLWVVAIMIYGAMGLGIAKVLGLFDLDSQFGGEGSPFQLGPDGKMMPTPRTIGMIYGIIFLAMMAFSVFAAWYRASQIRHFINHTHFDGATFKSTLSTAGLIWVSVSNVFIVLGTLGILAPIAQARLARYMVNNLEVTGTVRLAEITQATEQNIRYGEGLAQAFDVDAF